ncbi:hypothetical protein BC830DRAFT_29657 [Chytriomyces sp. MP71]|nr:hypothetical protein BC830DRAFT_29657 [Chytriomyces sp. MP71]
MKDAVREEMEALAAIWGEESAAECAFHWRTVASSSVEAYVRFNGSHSNQLSLCVRLGPEYPSNISSNHFKVEVLEDSANVNRRLLQRIADRALSSQNPHANQPIVFDVVSEMLAVFQVHSALLLLPETTVWLDILSYLTTCEVYNLFAPLCKDALAIVETDSFWIPRYRCERSLGKGSLEPHLFPHYKLLTLALGTELLKFDDLSAWEIDPLAVVESADTLALLSPHPEVKKAITCRWDVTRIERRVPLRRRLLGNLASLGGVKVGFWVASRRTQNAYYQAGITFKTADGDHHTHLLSPIEVLIPAGDSWTKLEHVVKFPFSLSQMASIHFWFEGRAMAYGFLNGARLANASMYLVETGQIE